MKEIYAALQICEEEVIVLVGEYHNHRFNVIKLEREACFCLDSEFRIINKNLLIKAIKAACDRCAKLIGSEIEKFILMLPPINFKRIPLTLSSEPEGSYLKKSDVARVLKDAMKVEVDDNLIIINALVTRYTVDGISNRHLPLRESCTSFTIDVDLLCVNRDLAYEYVGIIEESGYEILDICLDTYAISKEASLLEQSMSQNIILLNISRRSTSLTLLQKGRLLNSEILKKGLHDLAISVNERYGITLKDAYRLIKYNTNLDTSSNDAIFVWSDKNQNMTLSENDLRTVIKVSLDAYIDKLVSLVEPIVENENTVIVIAGEGAEMKAIASLLAERTSCEIRCYFPSTIGIRNADLAAIYGSLFIYHDTADIFNEHKSSIDLYKLENVITRKGADFSQGDTLTTRIKNLFENNRKKEEK